MNYTLNVYGWSAEFIGKTITKEQTQQIEDLMVESETEDVMSLTCRSEECPPLTRSAMVGSISCL